MASSDLVRREDEIDPDNEVELTPLQVKALDKLEELGGAPRASTDAPWSKNAQIRAYQMMFEQKLGGRQPGAGRPAGERGKRATAELAERIRNNHVNRMEQALKRGLDDENARTALQAVEVAVKIETQEATLRLKEDELDAEIDRMDREALIAAVITAGRDPQLEVAVGSSEVIDIPPGDVIEYDDTQVDGAREAAESTSGAAGSGSPRDNGGTPRVNDRGRASRVPPKGESPWKKVAKRRAVER